MARCLEVLVMWPFTRKQNDEQPSYMEAAAMRLRAFREIGEEFDYMGVRMVVRDHTACQVTPTGIHCWPSLQCDYVDQLGRIQTATFSPSDLPGLRRMNGEGEPPTVPQPAPVWCDRAT